MKRLFQFFLFITCLFVNFPVSAKIDVKVIETPTLKLKAWLNEDHSIPVVSLVISFRAGGCFVPQRKAGISSLLAAMLTEGAGDLTTQDFHEKLDDLGIELSAHADLDRLVLTLRTPRQHLQEALKLFYLVLHKPRFDQDVFERLKKQALASLENQSQTPMWIASRNLEKILYGPHPYALPLNGTLESLQRINVRDMAKFMKDHFSLDRVRLAASGDITASSLGKVFDDLLSTLPLKGFRQKLSSIKFPTKGAVSHQVTPHPQATILFAHKGLPHSHPDFMKYYLIEHILGGGSESRLMTQLRDKAGLAYYANTAPLAYRYVSLLSGNLGTKGESAFMAIKKVKEIFASLRDKGITQKELSQTKKHLVGRFPMGFTSSKQIASVFHAYQIYRFKPDYFEERERIIQSMTLKEINDFAKSFFDPASLVFSVAGRIPGDKPAPESDKATQNTLPAK